MVLTRKKVVRVGYSAHREEPRPWYFRPSSCLTRGSCLGSGNQEGNRVAPIVYFGFDRGGLIGMSFDSPTRCMVLSCSAPGPGLSRWVLTRGLQIFFWGGLASLCLNAYAFWTGGGVPVPNDVVRAKCVCTSGCRLVCTFSFRSHIWVSLGLHRDYSVGIFYFGLACTLGYLSGCSGEHLRLCRVTGELEGSAL